MPGTWGDSNLSAGFFPAEMCFSERLIPVLAEQGVQWTIVPDVHIARACADYPYQANQDNCDPPNRADQVNPAQGSYYAQSISRGVTTKVPAPYGFRPHRAQYVDPATGAVSTIVVVPAANGMSWNEGYGTYGTGEIDAIAAQNDPAKPMLVLFAHDGDNAWAGGYSYYHDNVTGFSHAAAAAGYEPTTIAEFLADHPVAIDDIVHVEDGGWVNADGDFGSPQFINWNWPLYDASGDFDIPNGWAVDERNWAVLVAAVNRVLTAEQYAGAPDIARVVDPTQPGTTALEQAWHFLLAGFESGYMYYGSALDMEVKPTLAANRATEHAAAVLAGGGTDLTPPTVWLPQRLPWNPGGMGGGALWGYPGGSGAAMSQDFHVWTFVHDVSGLASVRLLYRADLDGTNPLASTQNETYTGGAEVGAWQSLGMIRRVFPSGNVFNDPSIDFTMLPSYIADQYWVQVTGLEDALIDYYVEAIDSLGNVQRSPIQHVYVGTGGTSGGEVVTWEPAEPVAGGTLTIRYDAVAGSLPDDTNPVYIHIGHSGWTQIVTPDPAMTWDAGSARWTTTYAIPSSATQVDFVFQNGAGTWDNNGGADWHVTVAGAQAPPHVVDGALDSGVPLAASCNGRDLYAEYDGRWLYLAASPVGATAGLDHFVFVTRPATSGTRNAPWAKSGTAARWDLFLASEDANSWTGWFDADETPVSSGVQKATGAVLEGLVDVVAVWGTAPASLRLAFAAYGSPDGGALQQQSPCGNADAHLDAGERVSVEPPASAASEPADAIASIRLVSPARGSLRGSVELGTRGMVQVDLLDVRGRQVRSLFTGPAPQRLFIDTAAAGGPPLPAGVYFLRVTAPGGSAARRAVLLR
jgi:hypothetical protein